MSMQIGGLASGLDTVAIIDQLMALERRPINVLNQRKSALSTRNSAFQALNTRLSALQAKLTDLMLDKNLRPKSATSSDANVVTALPNPDAAAGTYQIKINQLATATKVSSTGALATPADGATTTLASVKPANTTAITTGTFTIGGATITIKSTTATLDNLVAAINVAGGKTADADYDDALIAVTNADGSTYNPALAEDRTGLGDAAAFLTAAGQIQLDVSANTSVAIGRGGDTSNLLSVAGLTSPTSSGTLRIGARLNVVQAAAKLNAANLTTAIGGDVNGDGKFKINGVEIAYNVGNDSLNDVIGRINNSAAGVMASYNSIEDRLVLTNKATGSTAIGLEDVTGNFLAATEVINATQTTGQNARITVDGVNGNVPIESATNEFKDIIPGVTFTAKKVETASWTTVTVARDMDSTLNAVKGFINEYNATVDALDAARAKGQPLQSDGAIADIRNKLARLIYEPVSGLSDSPNTLSAIGIGTTTADRKHLSLDETKFKAALDANTDRVIEIFKKDSTTDNPLGVVGRMDAYLDELKSATGVFASRKDSFSRQSKQIDDQISSYETRIEQRRRIMTAQFTAMEQAVGLMKSQQSAMLAQLGTLQSQ